MVSENTHNKKQKSLAYITKIAQQFMFIREVDQTDSWYFDIRRDYVFLIILTKGI